jgi:hypothetical protein
MLAAILVPTLTLGACLAASPSVEAVASACELDDAQLCPLAPRRSSSNLALMQVAKVFVKQQKSRLGRRHEEDTAEEDDPKEKEPGISGEEKAKLVKASAARLKKILAKALANSNKSGLPYEYFLDVDYLHDANNPLDNDEPESSEGSSEKDEAPRDELEKPKAPDKPIKQILAMNCTTVDDPRGATMLTMTGVAKAGTPCVFGADERDQGGHCIMDDGKYGTYGWCYTTMDKTAWGSCSEYCPLGGAAGVLERRIDDLDQFVARILAKVRRKKNCSDVEEKPPSAEASSEESSKAEEESSKEESAEKEGEESPKKKPEKEKSAEKEEKPAEKEGEESPKKKEPEEVKLLSRDMRRRLEVPEMKLVGDMAQAEALDEFETKSRSFALVAKVIQLGRLVEQGLLSKEEFEELKKEVMRALD